MRDNQDTASTLLNTQGIVQAEEWSDWAVAHSKILIRSLEDANAELERQARKSHGSVRITSTLSHYGPSHSEVEQPILVSIHDAGYSTSSDEPVAKSITAYFAVSSWELRSGRASRSTKVPGTSLAPRAIPGMWRGRIIPYKKDAPSWLITMLRKRVLESDWTEETHAKLRLVGARDCVVREISGNDGGFGIRIGPAKRYDRSGVPAQHAPHFAFSLARVLRPVAEEMLLRNVFHYDGANQL